MADASKKDFVFPLKGGSEDFHGRKLYLEPSNGVRLERARTFETLYGNASCFPVDVHGTVLAEFMDRVLPEVIETLGQDDPFVREWKGKQELYRRIARETANYLPPLRLD